MTDAKSTAVERCIRRRKNGFEAYVRINGKQVSKFFRLNTPIELIREWRRDELLRASELFDDVLSEVPIPPKAETGGYVYFVHVGDYVKIGKACDVRQRLEELQTAHPEPLRLVAYIKSDRPRSAEAVILREYEQYRARGEWFRLSFRIRKLIRHHAKAVEMLAQNAGTPENTNEI